MAKYSFYLLIKFKIYLIPNISEGNLNFKNNGFIVIIFILMRSA